MSRSTHGAVAAGHPATADAGLFALRHGGNAVDAVVAAALAASVCEALLTGLGGGGLLTVRDGRTGEIGFVDAFSSFPGRAGGLQVGEFDAIRVDYGPLDQAFHVGRGSVAVPGAARGLALAHSRYGRLPLAVLAEPAAALADDGWMVTRTTGVVCSSLRSIIERSERASAIFMPDGSPLRAGAIVRTPRMAIAMESFGRDGAEAFTTGPHGDALARCFGPPGGSLSGEDLAAHQPAWRRTLRVEYRGATIHLPGPPCVGGPLVAFGLSVLAALDPGEEPTGRGRTLALVMDATERARRDLFLDPFLPGAVDRLLDPARVAQVAEALRHRRDAHPAGQAPGAPGPALGNTTHVSCVDEDGFAASWTSSNGETCGVLWPEIDLPVNNFLGEADLHPMGFHRGSPGGPLMTMMTPTIVELPDRRLVVLGTGGANRIRTTMLQVIDALAREQDLDTAVVAPRLHVEGGVASIESAPQRPEFEAAMAALGFRTKSFTEPHLYFGGVHAVARSPAGFSARGDARRDGAGGIT